jgi:ATP-dependent Clp protease, protease subunit
MATLGLNFHGTIGHPATTKLRNAICACINERLPSPQQPTTLGARKYDKLFLFINSTGGSLDDGISLYGLLRTIPIEVTTINTGIVASIAILPFLAGKKRIAFPHSFFHFHSFEWNYSAPHNMTRLEFADHTQLLDAARNRTVQVLKEDAAFTDAAFDEIKNLNEPVIKDATFAKEEGIVQEINYVAFPDDMAIFNVDY